MKKHAESGDRVVLHLTGKTETKEVFVTTKDKQPAEITLGEGKVISGVENGIIGMQVGESRTFTVPPEKAFGEKNKNLVTSVKKDDLPKSIQPSIGQVLPVKDKDDQIINARITKIEADDITFDANHPLAGQNLSFEVQLLDIR